MAKLQVQTKEKRFPIAPTLYGLFFEDINRAGDGGLYPEMLRNRAFDDSLVPVDMTLEDDGWLVSPNGYEFAFHNGEGFQRWIRDNNDGVETPIPAWYAENADMVLDTEHTLNANRAMALAVDFAPGGKIWNIGYAGVPAKAGEPYKLYFFADVPASITVTISMEAAEGVLCAQELTLSGSGYTRYDLTLVPNATTGKAKFVITAPAGGKLTLGFISLMPANTFHGHGLRVDLAQKLADIHPKFLRFPGGCIVEGITDATAMRFKGMVGPVWERAGHINLWQYRMTDGLGYHEYLQLCEDIGAAGMYVCNCGITCQLRKGGGMEGAELDEMLDDALAALEYALGGVDTKWGALRAQMGHPEPFPLRYLEIGNENMGEVYFERYKLFYDTITPLYPELKIIANTHLEREGLPLDVADEHFYSTPDFFARGATYYDGYDRNGPEIFVGEFAVTGGPVRTLYPAISEAVFLIGMERNQDIVTMAAYAPLFENINYGLWAPDLIVFDNLRSFALPSYYVWKLFGASRGENVVSSQQSSDKIYVPGYVGGPVLMGAPESSYRNPVWKGQPVAVSHELMGTAEQTDNGILVHGVDPESIPPMMRRFGMLDRTMIALGEDVDATDGVFEVEVLAEEGKTIAIGVCCAPLPKGEGPMYMEARNGVEEAFIPWSSRNVRPITWSIRDGKSVVSEGSGMRSVELSETVDVDVTPGAYVKLRMEFTGTHVACYLNGELLQTGELPYFNAIETVATDDDREVILKITNMGDTAEPVEITLDCDVEADYQLGLLTGDPAARNSLDNPENVHETWTAQSGAAQSFTYEAPACSVNVLRLTKK